MTFTIVARELRERIVGWREYGRPSCRDAGGIDRFKKS
jgi:hypothetical protein